MAPFVIAGWKNPSPNLLDMYVLGGETIHPICLICMCLVEKPPELLDMYVLGGENHPSNLLDMYVLGGKIHQAVRRRWLEMEKIGWISISKAGNE